MLSTYSLNPWLCCWIKYSFTSDRLIARKATHPSWVIPLLVAGRSDLG